MYNEPDQLCTGSVNRSRQKEYNGLSRALSELKARKCSWVSDIYGGCTSHDGPKERIREEVTIVI